MSLTYSNLESFETANFYVRKFLLQESINFLYKEVPNFNVFNGTEDWKLFGRNWDLFRNSPEETIGFDFTNFGFKVAHITLIMTYKDDVWLGVSESHAYNSKTWTWISLTYWTFLDFLEFLPALILNSMVQNLEYLALPSVVFALAWIFQLILRTRAVMASSWIPALRDAEGSALTGTVSVESDSNSLSSFNVIEVFNFSSSSCKFLTLNCSTNNISSKATLANCSCKNFDL